MNPTQVRLIAFFEIDGIAHAIHGEVEGGVTFINASDHSVLTLTHGEMLEMFELGRLRPVRR